MLQYLRKQWRMRLANSVIVCIAFKKKLGYASQLASRYLTKLYWSDRNALQKMQNSVDYGFVFLYLLDAV